MLKTRIIIALLLLSIGIGLGISQLRGIKSPEIHLLCQENLDKNYDKMLSLISLHKGKYISKRDTEEINLFSALLGNKLEFVDLRDPNNISFSFPSYQPEMSRKLVYCVDNRIQIGADNILEESDNDLRLENLGTTQNGYIWCTRIRECWFYWESYLPT